MLTLVSSSFRKIPTISFRGCAVCIKNRLLSSESSKAVNLSYYTYEKNLSEDVCLQPLIILHGLMGSKHNWQSLAKVFGRSGRKVIAVDARNHGESVHVEDMNYFLFRDDLLRLMDKQDIQQAVLLGHSMGGKTSMTTALTAPDRISGLIVEDVVPTTSPGFEGVPQYLEAMLRISLTFLESDSNIPLSKARRMALQSLSEAVHDEPTKHFLAANLVQKENRFEWRVNLDSIINNFTDIATFPKFEDKQYYGNVLFVGGTRSEYIQEKHYPLIRSLFPRAEVQYVEGAGHWVHSEQPQAFIKIVNDFLIDNGL